MKWLLTLATAAFLVVLTAPPATACPLCKEAVQSGEDGTPLSEEDQQAVKQAKAWNNSIYLFVGMPYLLVGGVGYLVYRNVKKAKQAGQQDPTA